MVKMRGLAFMKRAIVPLCLVLITIPLFTNMGHAQISEISIELHAPTRATAGETISIAVTIRKPQGLAITGYLKSHLQARTDAVAGFSGSEGFSTYVALNEEGWSDPGNRIFISIGENETESTYVLTNKIMTECPTVEARLRVRLSNINGDQNMRRDADSLIFISTASLESLAFAKIIVAAIIALTMIWGVAAAKRAK